MKEIQYRRGVRVGGVSVAVGALILGLLQATPATADEGYSAAESEALAAVALSGVDVAVPEAGEDGAFTAEGGAFTAGETSLDPDAGSVDIGVDGLAIGLPAAGGFELTRDGIAISPSENGLGVAVVPAEGGLTSRVLTVADETFSSSPTHRYDYDISLDAGTELRQLSNGEIIIVRTDVAVPAIDEDWVPNHDVDLVDYEAGLAESAEGVGEQDGAVGADEVVVASFEPAWAVDAEGVLLPTTYEIEGTTLTQVVDTEGAAFPVVADPIPLIIIALGAAVLRVGVPVAARAFTVARIIPGARLIASNGYKSFPAFKSAVGHAKPNHQWHHIVEQSQVQKFGAQLIHNKHNLVQVPTKVHQKCINSKMATSKTAFSLKIDGQTFKFATGATMRSRVQKYSLENQHRIGIALLRYCGVNI